MSAIKPLTVTIRICVVWIANTISFLAAAIIMDSVYVENFVTALFFAGLLGLVNALIWPLLMRLLLPITVYTMGLASIVLNATILLLLADFIPGVVIEGFWPAVLLTLVLSVLTALISRLLSIDDDEAYYRQVLKRHMIRRRGDRKVSNKPGVVFLEIDGLSTPIFKRILKEGYMPNLANWYNKTHKIAEWETDLSSQTGVCQAGILHGNNKNMPAFRWVEKRSGNTVITSSNPDDASLIERLHSNKRGLLSKNGASRSNMFSGDASDVLFTASHANDIKRVYNPILYSFFSTPYNFSRTFILFTWEIILEYGSQFRQYRTNQSPRLGHHHRRGVYPLLRAFTVILLRDMTSYSLIGDIYGGEHDAIYATFVGYDGIAHHSGVEDKDIYRTLNQLDVQFGRIERATKESQRRYHIVVLSDHGQSKGKTFKMRYGKTLEDLVKNAIGQKATVQSIMSSHEEWGHLNTLLTEAVQSDKSATRRTFRRLIKRKMYKDSVVLGPQSDVIESTKKIKKSTDLIVLGSGNLGLIYLTEWKQRMTYERINELFPTLILTLAQHQGIGYIVVKSSKYGLLAIGDRGVYHMASGKIEGKNPLEGYGKNAVHHLKRAGNYSNAPDILVNSMYWPGTQEIAAFEELIGAHGGLGGWQTRPFIMYPKELPYPKEKVVGAEELHNVIKKWI